MFEKFLRPDSEKEPAVIDLKKAQRKAEREAQKGKPVKNYGSAPPAEKVDPEIIEATLKAQRRQEASYIGTGKEGEREFSRPVKYTGVAEVTPSQKSPDIGPKQKIEAKQALVNKRLGRKEGKDRTEYKNPTNVRKNIELRAARGVRNVNLESAKAEEDMREFDEEQRLTFGGHEIEGDDKE